MNDHDAWNGDDEASETPTTCCPWNAGALKRIGLPTATRAAAAEATTPMSAVAAAVAVVVPGVDDGAREAEDFDIEVGAAVAASSPAVVVAAAAVAERRS